MNSSGTKGIKAVSADPVAIARDLLHCPSVTPAEGGALRFLEKTLKAAGFSVYRMTFQEPGTGRGGNSFGSHGTGSSELRLRGPYRRGAAGRRKGMEAPAIFR